MKVKIDADLCTGCGLCTDSVPDVFKMGDDVAQVLKADVPANLEKAVKEAAEDCPAEAIIVSEDSASNTSPRGRAFCLTFSWKGCDFTCRGP
jgi:ferredoxin